MPRSLEVAVENWPLASPFAISRGTKTSATVVVVTIRDGIACGRGESLPYGRYDETPETALAAIETAREPLTQGADRKQLQSLMPPGAARNAIDCALWDLEAKLTGKSAAQMAGITEPGPVETAFTLSLDTAEAMAAAARAARDRPVLKVKLGKDGDRDRIAAIRAAAPAARLIVDANEGWSAANLADNLEACRSADVALIEQPLAAGDDAILITMSHPVDLCADESFHVATDLAALRQRYDAVNIKLDKTGGLTEALHSAGRARALGFKVMVGCMVATSLAMAPAMLLAQSADFVDLDGPLLLARDRQPGLVYDNSLVHPPTAALWG
ncbi:MAG: dipeptide epimerase [Hyphomicrobiales bacterium]|nr:dipeptide epimerase [Hyphomicrobiales bacterium]